MDAAFEDEVKDEVKKEEDDDEDEIEILHDPSCPQCGLSSCHCRA